MKNFRALPKYFFGFVLLSLIGSCQKEPTDSTTPEAACQLAKAYYYNESGHIEDSLIYTYANNKISKASNAEGHFTLEYNNNKIIKRNFYEIGLQQPGAYDVVSYNPDGTLKSIKSYFQFNPQTIPAELYEFVYSGNKLVKFDVSYYDPVISQYELYETTSYTYTGDNITQSITSNVFGGASKDTLNYAHDSNKNYFATSNALLIDFSFMEEINGEVIPLLMSGNNVTKIFQDGDEFPLSYIPDANGNFSEWHFEGKLASRYLYDCK